jgi:ParB-like chromosome segregation protein Spo0J
VKKTEVELKIPPAELVDVNRLRVDGENPNRMGVKQIEALKTSIQRWGFIVPIIANREWLVADGEQRLTVARELGMKQVSVIRLPVEDVDRRLLRQVLNKLRGEHELLADAYEFQRVIESGYEDDLKYLLDLSDTTLERYLSELRGVNEPAVPPVTETTITQGDIYQLGVHRLMCGDATNPKDVQALMDGRQADMVFTDPPYGINYLPEGKDQGRMQPRGTRLRIRHRHLP